MKLTNRKQFIYDMSINKSVLDFGSNDESNTLSFFNGYKNYVKELVGVDLVSNDPRIIKANVCDFNINRYFDVVVAGEIIEHLTNIDGFFNSCKNHMNKDSVLIVTTPNPYSFMRLFEKLFKSEVSNYKDHVLLLDKTVFFNLVKRYDFDIIDTFYCFENKPKSLLYKLNNFVGLLFPKFSTGYLFVLKRR